MERDIGVCGTVVTFGQFYFSCGISVILNSKCGIAAFSETAGWFVSIIMDDIETYPPSSSMFFESFPVSDWTFPMKLKGNLQFLG